MNDAHPQPGMVILLYWLERLNPAIHRLAFQPNFVFG